MQAMRCSSTHWRWFRLAAVVLTCVAVLAPEAWAYRGKKKEAGKGGEQASEEGQAEFKANEMLSKGLEFLQQNQEERGVKLISSIPRLFPKAKVALSAYMELGKYYVNKHNYDLAVKQFLPLEGAEDEELRAEALYQMGICYYNLNNFDRAFMILRKVTNEFPWSVFANEAYYYIGLCHFKLGRWAKAVEALEMVGASVPSTIGEKVLGEAGQRFYVKIYDQDLVVLKEAGGNPKVTASAASGDSEAVDLQTLGQSGEYFLGSVPTQPGDAKAGDGILQIIGGDVVKVEFADEHTESGERNRKLLSTVQMVSTASGGFTDGAYREYTKGVFGNNDCFIRVKDLDRDVTPQKDSISCRVRIEYKVKKERPEGVQGVDLSEEEFEIVIRDTLTATLAETGEHTGIFVGSVKTEVVGVDDQVNQGDALLSAAQGDMIVMEYDDEAHISEEESRQVQAEARMLIGAIQDVKIEHREVQSLEIKARKQLIEAKIFLKLGSIFKEVGLDTDAYEKADEGLERAEEVIRTSMKASMDRAIVEEAFSIKWDLLLVKDRLSDAISVCHTLMRLFPDSTLVDQALLKIGLAKKESPDSRQVDEAVSIFSSILRLEKSMLKAEAAYRIAEIHEQRAMARLNEKGKPDLSHAMLAYKQCAENYPDSSFAGDALDKIINFYINNSDYRRAIELMEQVMQDYPDASFLDRVLLKWGIAAYRLNDLDTAKQKLDQLLAEYPNSPLAEKGKKYKEAIEKKATPAT